MQQLDEYGYPIRKNREPLPPLDKPDPVLFYDLSPEDQARAEIYLTNDQTRKWRFKNGQQPSSL